PPDNARTFQDQRYARTNQLFYELAGTVFRTDSSPSKATFQLVSKPRDISPTTLSNYFGVTGIANSARDKRDIKFGSFHFRDSQVRTLAGPDPIDILVVPVDGPQPIMGLNNERLNPWQYDS